MIVELTTTNIEVVPELNAVNLTITPTLTSGAGGGGSTSYTVLTSKPQINSVELLGNKTSAQLGLAPALGADDNYVTDAEKIVIGNTSGINTGDQDLSGFQSLNTGYIDGMALSINADNTKFDIAAGHYSISNNDPVSPISTIKHYAGSTANSIPLIANSNATYVALDSNMTIVLQASPFSDSQRRTLCTVGACIHSNRVNINAVNEIKAPIINDVNQMHDFMKAVGALNLSGNVYSSSTGMQLNKSAGVIFALGINASNILDPHKLTISEQTGLTFRYRLKNGTEFADRTTIDPTKYDDGTSVPATIAGTRFTVQHINLFQSGLTRVQYGQTTYANFDEAKANFQVDSFVTETNIADNAVFRAYLIIKENATNIATEIAAGRALFIPVDKFGNVISGGSSALTYDSIIAALGFVPANVANVIPKSQNVLTKDPTGFSEPQLVVVTGNSTNRTITLSGTVVAAYQGEVVPTLINGYVSPAHGTDTSKKYFLSYDGSTIAWRDFVWEFHHLMIAVAKYDLVNLAWKYYREVHGLMNWQTHQELHKTIGTYKGSGGAFPSASYVLNNTTAANRRPNIDETVIYDEDLPTTLAALTSKLYTQFNLTGSAVENTVFDTADIVKLSTNNPYYNLNTAGTWSNALMPANSVGTIWVYAQPMAEDAFSQKHRFIFVQPQWITQATGSGSPAITTAINTEKLRNSGELNLNGLVGEEIVCIGRIIIDYTASNWRLREVLEISGTKVSQSQGTSQGVTSHPQLSDKNGEADFQHLTSVEKTKFDSLDLITQTDDATSSGTILIEPNTVKILTTSFVNTHTFVLTPSAPTVFTKQNECTVVLSVGATAPNLTITPPLNVVFIWMDKAAPATLTINKTYTFVFFWINTTTCQVYHAIKA